MDQLRDTLSDHWLQLKCSQYFSLRESETDFILDELMTSEVLAGDQ